MRSLLRRAPAALPGLVGTVRVDRRIRDLVPRLEPGDVAVVDLLDLDADTASALLRARVSALVNVGPLISGRYPTLGPTQLADAGVVLIDQVGSDALDRLGALEGRAVRVHDGAVLPAPTRRRGSSSDGDRVDGADEVGLATGRVLDQVTLTHELERARRGLVVQLESLDRDGSELIQRESDLLLHGIGLPSLTTSTSGRPVVVVAPGPDLAARLRSLRHYLREQRPVLIAVDSAVSEVRRRGLRPDVAVVSSGSAATAEAAPPVTDLAGVADVVVRLAPGDPRDTVTDLDRQGVLPTVVESDVASADLALLLARAGGPTVVVGVGVGRTVEQLIDARGAGGASHVPTRLRVGPSLVDAAAVAHLYSGRIRPRHLFLVLVVGLLALAVAVAVTPVGQDWIDQAGLQQLVDRWRDWLTGLGS